MLYSVKHREMENLRFRDFEEQRSGRRDDGMKMKCEIVEKHIGMSIALQEKKLASLAQNDKIRNKMAKEAAKQGLDRVAPGLGTAIDSLFK